VARLFLASDILHNSTAPVRNASRYRNRLEETIPDVFQSFQVRSKDQSSPFEAGSWQAVLIYPCIIRSDALTVPRTDMVRVGVGKLYTIMHHT